MAALITPEELIVLLDFPDDSQATDRATLVCNIVIGAVNQVAGSVLVEPFPEGLKGIALIAAGRLYNNPTLDEFQSVGATSTRFGDVHGILTADEKTQIGGLVGVGRPAFEFPGTWPYPDPVEATASAVIG